MYGWNEELFQQKQDLNYKEFIHGRVTVAHKACYEVMSETRRYVCELTESMLCGRDISESPGREGCFPIRRYRQGNYPQEIKYRKANR